MEILGHVVSKSFSINHSIPHRFRVIHTFVLGLPLTLMVPMVAYRTDPTAFLMDADSPKDFKSHSLADFVKTRFVDA